MMNRINFAKASGVVVDECRAHGVWLDNDELDVDAYRKARKRAGEHKVSLRLATCMLGVERVAYFDRIRGIYA